MSGEIKDAAEATSAGCMCAVFQLFDLHHFQLPLNQQNHPSNGNSFLHEEAISPKGVEAPRNSLELDEPASIKAPSAMKEEENLNFPVGIQIKTSHGKISSSSPRVSRTEDFSSECSSNSPGIKTPNLVARLMGLDLLPETTSPSLTSSKSQLKSHFHQKNQRNFRGNTFFDDDISVGARSLPETPRISSSSRKSDVEYHHRLSLQVNKDEEIGFRKGRRFRHDNENNRSIGSSSPGHYARQIVKQVKESVSRRVGLSDITNRNRDEII
ncbi:hypothetical protein BUALT_Bualt06G0119000 [Buddleja alternifolia]|uniref:DUF3741 domain-containing protein n=1 Tax=Buddleja alternifolia TaxID=168488 RepID=A0AAV6XG40_9LAMI|nr:hypothetical protein BUALT_Bualt06G0119000 [Buddleja alternifolia]